MGKHTTKQAFLRELAELRGKLSRDLADNGALSLKGNLAARRMRATHDLLWFGQTYFPHYIRPHADGHPVEPSKLHVWLCKTLLELGEAQSAARLAIAAPRGEAKSTWLLIWVIWCIVHAHKHYILYIMDVGEQAAAVLEGIKAELELNTALAADYPKAVGVGAVWTRGVLVTRNGIKIQGRGARQRVRGLKHGARRPDLAILDDLENDIQVANPEQRDRLTNWLLAAVDNLGEAGESFDIVMIGTVLHHDSVLRRMQAHPLWSARVFQAIVSWPDRMDLWENWEMTLRRDGLEVAQSFYHKNADTMNIGGVVSWPSKRSLCQLMEIRVKIGNANFDKEYQNDPAASDALFSAPVFWLKRTLSRLLFGAVDPSMGKHSRSDPSAILIGSLNRETGVLDVIEARIRRRLPDMIVDEVIALQKDYCCLLWFVEAVQFQEFFRTELQRRAAISGVPLPAKPVVPTNDKHLRIARLQPPVAEGLIRFHSSQTTLLEQLRHFPCGDHDDGPDALEMLWTGALLYSGTDVEIKGFAPRQFSSQSPMTGFQI